MDKKSESEQQYADYESLLKNMEQIAEKSKKVLNEFLKRQSQGNGTHDPDPLNLGESFLKLSTAMMADPQRLFQAQLSLVQEYFLLWQNSFSKWMGPNSDQASKETNKDRRKGGDRRFQHPGWDEWPLFNYLKQSYLLTSRWLQDTVKNTPGLSAIDALKTEFYTRQFVDALSPSNFLLTNPEAIRETIDSKGENLVRGLQNLLDDLKNSEGELKIRQTDDSVFEVGTNLATTPGKVIYQNDLMQLIQYNPISKTVYKRPLLIIPPWINKYYILDLKRKNSFIRWAVERGYTLFVVSWVNPDERLAKKRFEDYMTEGVLSAIDAIELAVGENDVSAIGYCIGGTLLACTLAYMAAKDDHRIKAATFFTAQVDFSEPGELAVFIEEEQIKKLDERMAEKGYLDASSMANTFNMLRANDLIWSFVVNNYLMGREPYPFDLLYWNSDSTRLPRAMHLFYLKEMYLHNRLVEPGRISLDGVPIDLTKITIPVYIQSGREDHIAPYPSVFKAKHHFKGPVRFMVAGSGHIAGVVNPPAAKKYKYWMNEDQPNDLDDWMKGAQEHPGSWWPDWHQWLSKKSGKRIPARKPGSGQLACIEDAPGSYVKAK